MLGGVYPSVIERDPHNMRCAIRRDLHCGEQLHWHSEHTFRHLHVCWLQPRCAVMRSWCACLLDDDVACARPSSISPSPQRPPALKSKWCTLDLEGLALGGPRSTGPSSNRSSGPRSTGPPSKRLGQQQWCTLTIDADDEVRPEPQHDWRHLNVQDDVRQHSWHRPSVEGPPEPEALPVRRQEVPFSASTLCALVQHAEEEGLELLRQERHGLCTDSVCTAGMQVPGALRPPVHLRGDL